MTEYEEEIKKMSARLFGADARCSICQGETVRHLAGMVDYAHQFEVVGRPLIAICYSCAREVANLFTFKHSGAAEFDYKAEWELPTEFMPPKSRKRRSVSRGTAMRIFARDGYRCMSCSSREQLVIDHIHPVSKGGTDDEENLQTLCSPCNAEKSAKTDWVPKMDRAEASHVQ